MTEPKNPKPAPLKDGDAPAPAVIDPARLAASGPEGAPQPVPRKDDPGINANVIS